MSEEKGYDPTVAKEFIERLFQLEQEIKLLQNDRKDLKDEFKKRLNTKLVGKLIRLVKAKISINDEAVSPQTVDELENLIKDHIGVVIE